ncbi:MAG: DUF3422 domain-containing protein [bacterium]|nr:DUF3422 domain-containing protein [bacterium]
METPQYHRHYHDIHREVYARPFPVLSAPVVVTQLTLLQDRLTKDIEWDHLVQLCRAMGVPEPPDQRSYHGNFGEFHLHWQRHLEFSTYQLVLPHDGSGSDRTALEFLPEGWLRDLPGEMVGAVHVMVEDYEAEATTPGRLAERLGTVAPMGAQVRERQALAWSNFVPDEQGFTRYLIQTKKLSPAQTGRLTQRILELETYRLLALLALPVIKQMSETLDGMEYSMLLVSDHIQRIFTAEDQKSLLAKLSAEAARLEVLRSHDYRFSAAHAYFELTEERLEELKQEKLAGILTFSEFLNRRMVPARRTLRHTQRRINDLIQRIGHARELLQTNISLTIEEQNQELLLSMEKRSHLQLRLQEAVEGLSIAAISYYMVSLVKYLFSAFKSMGIPINKDLATGIAVPLVIFTVWFAIHKIKKHVLTDEEEAH